MPIWIIILIHSVIRWFCYHVMIQSGAISPDSLHRTSSVWG